MVLIQFEMFMILLFGSMKTLIMESQLRFERRISGFSSECYSVILLLYRSSLAKKMLYRIRNTQLD